VRNRLFFALALLSVFLLIFLSRPVSAMGGVQNTSYAVETYIPFNGTVNVVAGNIYSEEFTSTEKTYRWVGLWGNITGSIQLRTTSNSFRTWPVSTVTAGSVLYATTYASGIDPTSFSLTNVTFLNQADVVYGYLTTVTDSISNTYIGVATFQSPSMQTGITTNTSVLDSGSWVNYMIRRTSSTISDESDVIWAVEVDPGQTAFNSQLADYELLLPENEEVGDGEGTLTTYYLWLEFD
jgi:hypothetical protein